MNVIEKIVLISSIVLSIFLVFIEIIVIGLSFNGRHELLYSSIKPVIMVIVLDFAVLFTLYVFMIEKNDK